VPAIAIRLAARGGIPRLYRLPSLTEVPDALRGRLSAIHILVVTGGPRLGDLEAGVVAQAFTPLISVVSGGLVCVVGAAFVAALYPQLRRYRAASAT